MADLSRALQRATTSVNEAFSLLNEPASSATENGDWAEVKKAADLVSKHATTIGVLWTQGPKIDEAGEAMKTFFDSLQGLLLLCHGCTVGAGPTLLTTIRNAAKNVLETSLSLLTRAVSFSVKGSERGEREQALPALVGAVWDSCTALKKTPFTNRAAIGRSLAQIATSVKDVLREIGEMREGGASEHVGCGCGHSHGNATATDNPSLNRDAHSHSHDRSGHERCGHDHDRSGHLHLHDQFQHLHTHDGPGECGHDHSRNQHARASNTGSCGHNHAGQGHLHTHHHDHAGHSHDHSSHENCGHNHGNRDQEESASDESLEFNEELSPEEMEVVDATKGVVGSLLDFIKQLLYVAADGHQGNDITSTIYLENVLKHCKSLGVEVDEFGASLYPPQEMTHLRERITTTAELINLIEIEVTSSRGSVPEGLESASQALKSAGTILKQSLGGSS